MERPLLIAAWRVGDGGAVRKTYMYFVYTPTPSPLFFSLSLLLLRRTAGIHPSTGPAGCRQHGQFPHCTPCRRLYYLYTDMYRIAIHLTYPVVWLSVRDPRRFYNQLSPLFEVLSFPQYAVPFKASPLFDVVIPSFPLSASSSPSLNCSL